MKQLKISAARHGSASSLTQDQVSRLAFTTEDKILPDLSVDDIEELVVLYSEVEEGGRKGVALGFSFILTKEFLQREALKVFNSMSQN